MNGTLRAASRLSATHYRRSILRRIAYAAAILLVDDRTGEVFDYRHRNEGRREDVLRVTQSMPHGLEEAITSIWNRISLHNTRPFAVIGRGLIVSHVDLLDRSARERAIDRLRAATSERYRTVVLTCDHAARFLELVETYRQDECDEVITNKNWHTHIFLGYCEIRPDGSLGRKIRELDPICVRRDRRAAPGLDIQNFCEWARPFWEMCVNDELRAAGLDERVDLRTLREQGIQERPTLHLGPRLWALELAGTATQKGDRNRILVAQNEKRRTYGRRLKLMEAALRASGPTVRQVPLHTRKSSRSWLKAFWAHRHDEDVEFVSRRFEVLLAVDGGAAILDGARLLIVDSPLGAIDRIVDSVAQELLRPRPVMRVSPAAGRVTTTSASQRIHDVNSRDSRLAFERATLVFPDRIDRDDTNDDEPVAPQLR